MLRIIWDRREALGAKVKDAGEDHGQCKYFNNVSFHICYIRVYKLNIEIVIFCIYLRSHCT